MTEQIAKYIERLVAEAPPLTPAQKSKLSMLFSRPDPEPEHDEDGDFEALKEVATDGQH